MSAPNDYLILGMAQLRVLGKTVLGPGVMHPFVDIKAAQALLAEIDRLHKDAERYRWLRERLEIRDELPYRGLPRPALVPRIGRTFIDSVVRPHERDVALAAELDGVIDARLTAEAGEA